MHDSTDAAVTQRTFCDSHIVPTDASPAVRLVENGRRILRMKQLIERTKLSRATLYVLMSKDPYFPRKIKLTARAIGFLESEVDAWLSHRANLASAMD